MKTDLEADMTSECAKLGPVDKVSLPCQLNTCMSHARQCSLCTDAISAITAFCLLQIRVCQYHPEGVVTIKFKRDDAAQECLKVMNGRFFGGRQLTAELWDGTTNYNVRKPQESEEEQAARLARFAAEIEQAEQ